MGKKAVLDVLASAVQSRPPPKKKGPPMCTHRGARTMTQSHTCIQRYLLLLDKLCKRVDLRLNKVPLASELVHLFVEARKHAVGNLLRVDLHRTRRKRASVEVSK